ncbi:hypothetical protein M8J77_008639 [Diaphorina citri]|nr:hypothetical protein M8J77_008639 [Diaphorina citri]
MSSRDVIVGDKWPLGVVGVFFVLTVGVSTLLALYVNQQAAYLWLSFVLIGILFLTTFTRTSRLADVPFDNVYDRRPSEHLRACTRFNERHGSGPAPPYYVRIDPPPSYNAAITIYPDTCEPPPYINVVIQNSNPPTPSTADHTRPRPSVPNTTTTLPPIVDQLPLLHHLEAVQNSTSVSDVQVSLPNSSTTENTPACETNVANQSNGATKGPDDNGATSTENSSGDIKKDPNEPTSGDIKKDVGANEPTNVQ